MLGRNRTKRLFSVWVFFFPLSQSNKGCFNQLSIKSPFIAPDKSNTRDWDVTNSRQNLSLWVRMTSHWTNSQADCPASGWRSVGSRWRETCRCNKIEYDYQIAKSLETSFEQESQIDHQSLRVREQTKRYRSDVTNKKVLVTGWHSVVNMGPDFWLILPLKGK